MSSFNRRESAEFAIAADAETEKVLAGVDKALGDSAGRGFPAPPGPTLEAVLWASVDSKTKMVAANAKIYDGRREVIFQEQEYALSVHVRLAKLVMELYREQIFNALAIEQEQLDAYKQTSRADVERMNVQTEQRQRAIIQARAEAEQRIIVYKRQLVAAEAVTLGAEAILIQAQLATAEKKLEIISSIYQVLAAEELVLAAENRRAASLTKVLAAELITAGVKKEMIPFYLQQAEARQELAAAITAEIPITEAIIKLGYDRIDLKTTEEYAGHLEREAQEELELKREAYLRASLATQMAKLQSHRTLQEYQNIIQAQIQGQRKELQMDEVTFRLASGLAREAIGVDNEVALTQHEILDLTKELANVLKNMDDRAYDRAATVKDGAVRFTNTDTTSLISRRIREGVI